MTVLVIDTTGPWCAAGLVGPDAAWHEAGEPIGRGHAERLAPMVQVLLKQAGIVPGALDRIGVATGPGSFAGTRVGVAFARGLALALEIPAIGISTFDAITKMATLPHLATVPAPQDRVYIAPQGAAPALVSMEEAHAIGLPLALPPAPAELVVAMARVARARLVAGAVLPPPAPLYIRAADAAPARDAPPVMLPDDAD